MRKAEGSTMIRRFKAWRKRRREGVAHEQTPTLREFVYLDEVSVTSLLSSRLGAVPSEITDTVNDSTTAEINSALDANAAVIKSRIGSRFEATRTENSQVLRKASIQATFKDLYEHEQPSLVIRPTTAELEPPESEVVQAVLSGVHTDDVWPWVIGRQQLQRGRLAEVEVELQAHPLFRVSTIMTTFADLISESQTLQGLVAKSEFENATEVNRLLEKLMAGLIPVRCRVVDYSVVVIGGKECLIHRRMIEQISREQQPSMMPVYLVGVTEQELFWKDIRRVLFSEARFHVLGRLSGAGVSKSWTSVKLVDVLGEVIPSLADDINQFSSGALATVRRENKADSVSDEPQSRVLENYAKLLASHYGLDLDDVARSQIRAIASETTDSVMSHADGREPFHAVDTLVTDRLESDIDRTVASNLRVQARDQAEDMVQSSATTAVEGSSEKTTRNLDSERYIDTEIIAIYW